MKNKNIIKQIAKESGVRIILCDKKKWGGKYGFKCEQYSGASFNGYKSKDEAYMEWAINTFGLKTVNALIKIYREATQTDLDNLTKGN